jgi:site-specific recombinase XerD
MDNAMLVRGLADRTRQSYIEAITKLTRYYRVSPDALTAAQVEAWLLYLVRERHLSFSTVNQAASACRLFYNIVLGLDRANFNIPMAKTPQRQPEILARTEVAALLAAARDLADRTLLMTIYAAGLRVSEACSLQVTDIDSAPDRLCLRVRQGKGGQDRYTLLAPTLLAALREYWRCARPRLWLFPNPGGNAPIDIKTAQRRYNQARAAAGGFQGSCHLFSTRLSPFPARPFPG